MSQKVIGQNVELGGLAGGGVIETLLSQGEIANSAFAGNLSILNSGTNTAEGFTIVKETDALFNGLATYKTNLVFKVDVINASVSIEVTDNFDKSADLPISSKIRILFKDTVDGSAVYLDTGTIKTLSGAATNAAGVTTIPMADTSGINVGDYIVKEAVITKEISFVDAGVGESFQDITAIGQVDSVEVVDGTTIDGIIPDLAHYWRLGTALSNGQTEPDLGSLGVDLIVKGFASNGNIANATVSLTTIAGNVDTMVTGWDAVRGGNSAVLIDPGGDNNPQVLGLGSGPWNKTFTFGFWVKWGNTNGFNMPIGGGVDNAPLGWSFFRDGANGNRIFSGGQSNTWSADSGGVFIHYMIEAVFTSVLTFRVFRNNSQVLSGFNGGVPGHSSGALARGGWFIIGSGGVGDGSNGLAGADLTDKFEEVFFVERVLTSQERTDIFNSGSGRVLDQEIQLRERYSTTTPITGQILKSKVTVGAEPSSAITLFNHGLIKQ